MEVWGVPVLATAEQILFTLRDEVVSQGIPLLKDIYVSGRNVMFTCPMHGNGTEKKPSCGVNEDDVIRGQRVIKSGTAHCFRCDYVADMAQLVSDVFGFNDAGTYGFRWIMSHFSAVSVEKRKPIELDLDRSKKAEEPVYVSEEELKRYDYTHPYMYERGLDDWTIDAFRVGYDRETHALTFPVYDRKGNPLFVQRRYIGQKKFMNEEVEKGQTIYAIEKIYKYPDRCERVIICESIIDALTCWKYKCPALALMGATATEGQIELLKLLPVRSYVFALDSDEAGEKGIRKLFKALRNDKLLYRVHFPRGIKDVNELDMKGYDFRATFDKPTILIA